MHRSFHDRTRRLVRDFSSGPFRSRLDIEIRSRSTSPVWRGLKWQRLKPYEDFTDMIERHWDGIAADCKPENNVSLGFVERLNNKVRVLQRRAYGLCDEEYLRLKVLTCILPKLSSKNDQLLPTLISDDPLNIMRR